MIQRHNGPRLWIVPITLLEANRYVSAVHRHHGPLPSHRFSIGVVDESGLIRGVATVGLPKAFRQMDPRTAEVNRVATDGCPNAPSALYGACRRIAREMGFVKLVTYILESEPGTSLRASGWRYDGPANATGREWSRRTHGQLLRTGAVPYPATPKGRWQVDLNAGAPAEIQWPAADIVETVSLFADLEVARGGEDRGV